ncbi:MULTISPECIES: HAD family phosphatase [Protofrankia]|uniref:HAD family hydrolase n=1 Tax=Protofrankia TaxID=2994361 RepID=UPI0006403A5C|nr:MULTISPECIES: HAD family phosphatase [Protofrankia]ONH37076.1 haloacid dehalogenase [Protofrankia sp. BMG5.30]
MADDARSVGWRPSPVEISVVWCDFGGVLTSPIPEAFDRFVAAAGVPAAALRSAIDAVAGERGMRMIEPLERGLMTQHEWGLRVTAALAPEWTPRVDLTRFGDHWYEGRRMNNALLGCLADCRRRGLRVGLLTNSVAEWEPHRAALMPDAGVFEVTINSHEIGLRKPDPEIYQTAEDAFGVAPRQCLLIDDTPVNCAAAQARGWQTILHSSPEQTLEHLARL